ncbi:MAG TPA: Trm112 family protein [Methylophaga aminisulfidivorans]|uniref:UPF0434 protein ENI26_07360 n=2 Tax=root TaxID=1 RepID=A0A7C2APR3_9GAMM|nr:Trm112 family protein [Methylophaga aminisulfidivorans]
MDNSLLEILACPICKGKLIYKKPVQELMCKQCRVAYPIHDDIPVMLAEQARELNKDEEL